MHSFWGFHSYQLVILDVGHFTKCFTTLKLIVLFSVKKISQNNAFKSLFDLQVLLHHL